MNNTVLPDSAGNCVQYPVIDHNGKEKKKRRSWDAETSWHKMMSIGLAAWCLVGCWAASLEACGVRTWVCPCLAARSGTSQKPVLL